MPKMTGSELVAQAHFFVPDMPFIVVSGYSPEDFQELMRKQPAVKAIFKKPITRAILGQKIEEILSNKHKKVA